MKKGKILLIFILIIGAFCASMYFIPSFRNIVYNKVENVPVIGKFIPKETVVEDKSKKIKEKPEEKVEEKTTKVEPQKEVENTVEEKVTASGINDEINYMLAEKLAAAHNVPFSDEILAEYTKTIFKNTPPQTPDTIENNPKTLVAIVGYKEYGKSLALDYVMKEIINKTALVKDEDRANEELVKTLLEKYKDNDKIKQVKGEDQKKEVALKLNAEENVQNFLEMEMKTMSGEIYTDLLKKYNPEYYNSVQKGNPIEIYDYYGQKPVNELTNEEVKDIISSQASENPQQNQNPQNQMNQSQQGQVTSQPQQ